jgi:hypothetical protein
MSTDLRRSHLCATMDVHRELVEENPEDYANNRRQIARLNAGLQEQTSRAGFRRGGVVTIPCVVHVVYNDREQDISDEQIYSQFTVLNQCFRNLDPDAHAMPHYFAHLAGDAQVEFKLAMKDPDNAPTSAITRTKTQKRGFSHNGDVKFDNRGGKSAWPSDRYFNIWVCALDGGLLGYAQFPGGPRATAGMVINYKAFGTIGTATAPFDKGKTAVHEAGHCFDLLHIWGDDGLGCNGSDEVVDTPNQAAENTGMPEPHITCDNGPNGDMYMNYMDYTDDAGMYMFTNGQIKRMDAALNGPLASLLTSDVLTPAKVQDVANVLKRKDGGDHKTKLAFDGVQWVPRSALDYNPEAFE